MALRTSLSWKTIATVVVGLAITAVIAPFAIQYLSNARAVVPYRPDETGVNLAARITVTFDTLTVHRTREGFLRGDGEYHVAAYVQGIQVPLTDASVGEGQCAGWGCPPMMDADEGDTFHFTTGTEVTVALAKSLSLSVFTVGVELDGCPRLAFPDVSIFWVLDKLTLVDVFKNPQLDSFHAVEVFQGIAADWGTCYGVLTGDNDVLGSLNKFYDPPGYGAGAHVELVNNGDFTLRYRINVVPTQGGLIGNP